MSGILFQNFVNINQNCLKAINVSDAANNFHLINIEFSRISATLTKLLSNRRVDLAPHLRLNIPN